MKKNKGLYKNCGNGLKETKIYYLTKKMVKKYLYSLIGGNMPDSIPFNINKLVDLVGVSLQ